MSLAHYDICYQVPLAHYNGHVNVLCLIAGPMELLQSTGGGLTPNLVYDGANPFGEVRVVLLVQEVRFMMCRHL